MAAIPCGKKKGVAITVANEGSCTLLLQVSSKVQTDLCDLDSCLLLAFNNSLMCRVNNVSRPRYHGPPTGRTGIPGHVLSPQIRNTPGGSLKPPVVFTENPPVLKSFQEEFPVTF